jgi:hypothetical protein
MNASLLCHYLRTSCFSAKVFKDLFLVLCGELSAVSRFINTNSFQDTGSFEQKGTKGTKKNSPAEWLSTTLEPKSGSSTAPQLD